MTTTEAAPTSDPVVVTVALPDPDLTTTAAAAVLTPEHKVYIGRATISNVEWTYAWLYGIIDSQCNGQTILLTSAGSPCGYKFTLDDGVTYHWEGYGGDTWLMWESGNKGGNLGGCEYVTESWMCGGEKVEGTWLCG